MAAALMAVAHQGTGGEPVPDVLTEIDREVRSGSWDPNLKRIDWSSAVRRASLELPNAKTEAERNLVYDRLLETLGESHTFRLPRGFPERNWGTAGLRIGQDGDGYAVKGVLPGTAAEREGMKLGDSVLAVNGKRYGKPRVNFRDLFLIFEGAAGSRVEVTWQPSGGADLRTSHLTLSREEPGDTLVWKSARVIRRDGKAYGYARLWGFSAETALAVVDLLLDRVETGRVKPELSGWSEIQGLLLDVRANSGGYDPNILATFLRGRWSAGDYYLRSREGRRLVPPVYSPLPVVLLVNSATASAGEALALKFRAHGIGSIVGETTAGMASGGATAVKLSDGSMLWISSRALEDLEGHSYEGRGVPPDLSVADRPPAAAGQEEAIVEAGLRALSNRKSEIGNR
ncbi:MAG TPA: S41 family peptidase [Thermoanaerobaculia bacterium]|nr:S41 family peptidase [Thermoanaerobaculia bacterium]